MRRSLLFLPAAFFLLSFAAGVRANDEVKAILDKAVKAHGGGTVGG